LTDGGKARWFGLSERDGTPAKKERLPMICFVRRTAAVLALGLLVAGCASSAQVAQRNEERCAARGYQPKTDALNNCVVQLEGERQQRMENNRREMMEKPFTPWRDSGTPWSP
jgi:outer membrane murein-binding lipoprotein Lpp